MTCCERARGGARVGAVPQRTLEFRFPFQNPNNGRVESDVELEILGPRRVWGPGRAGGTPFVLDMCCVLLCPLVQGVLVSFFVSLLFSVHGVLLSLISSTGRRFFLLLSLGGSTVAGRIHYYIINAFGSRQQKQQRQQQRSSGAAAAQGTTGFGLPCAVGR